MEHDKKSTVIAHLSRLATCNGHGARSSIAYGNVSRDFFENSGPTKRRCVFKYNTLSMLYLWLSSEDRLDGKS
jgi:hypothetical protein